MVSADAKYPIINHLDSWGLKIKPPRKWPVQTGFSHNLRLPVIFGKSARIGGCYRADQVMNLLSCLAPDNPSVFRLASTKLTTLTQKIGFARNLAMEQFWKNAFENYYSGLTHFGKYLCCGFIRTNRYCFLTNNIACIGLGFHDV